MFRFDLAVLIGVLACAGATAQDGPRALGDFEGQSDVGNVLHPGSAEYDRDSKVYTLSGSGDNMWFATDKFHFVWKKISADDVTLTAEVAVLGEAGNNHRKGVLMIRQSLDSDAAYVDAARHADGLTSLQFRDEKGSITREIEANVSGPAKLRIEKQGEHFYLWVAGSNEELQFAGGSARVRIEAPFYVGIGVTAHDKDAVATVVFKNVDLRTSVAHRKAKYSTVETVLQIGRCAFRLCVAEAFDRAGMERGWPLTYVRDGRRAKASAVHTFENGGCGGSSCGERRIAEVCLLLVKGRRTSAGLAQDERRRRG